MAGVEWEEVRARLEVIAEDLADMGRDRLRAALEADDESELSAAAAADERRLATARRAVLRAVAALGGGADDAGP